MSAAAAAAVKAAILALTDENTRKKIGWALAAILSPVILLIAFLCALGSGTASHNLSVVELCFYGGTVPPETRDEYRAYIEEMRAGFNLLDGSIENINELTEGEDGLDEIRVKALFYALYFGTDSPSQHSTISKPPKMVTLFGGNLVNIFPIKGLTIIEVMEIQDM